MVHRYRFSLLPLLTALFAIGASTTALHAQTLQIDKLIASSLEGITHFVRWPGESKSEQIVIAVLGDPEVIARLKEPSLLEQQGRDVRVYSYEVGDDLSHTDLLFVSSGHRSAWPRIIEQCRQHKVLAVGEESGFVKAGGAIEFVVRKNRLRFIASREHARSCGIQLSSKLLKLAVQ